ncbi:beta strand repeat-containing protein [Novosphingobium sp.]|uniref:beta strand repeat-containing protein n=1 Tax=Novosphingobium sp. TaxID=1874826 RepID=UPI003B524123
MPANETYVLTTGIDTIAGDSGINMIQAASDTLSSGDQIDGGSSGANILALGGAGTFDLTQPATLTDIAFVDATEMAGTSWQSVTLRSGLNVTVNVASVAGGLIYLYGANDADVFDLGAGADVITLGSASETVNGGGGPALVNMAAATAGALISGHGGTTTLGLSGGGTIELNPADTGLSLIKLAASNTAYTLTPTGQNGLIITDNSTTDDIVTLSSSTDELICKAASVTALVNAANAGATVHGGTGADILEITTGGTAVLGVATDRVHVLLDAATNLTLNTLITGVSGSSGNDTVALGTINLKATTSLNGAQGTNTLILQSAGTFRLALPSTLTNFQVIDAFEGAGQTVDLRRGMTSTINVTASTTTGSNAAITLNGVADSAVFNLGGGTDTVNLGSRTETVNGGSGTALINAKAAVAGALIHGGSGVTTLTLHGGGTATMNAGDNGISTVVLAPTTTAYVFTANAQAGLTIVDQGFGSDTVTAGGANQTLTGGARGRLTMVGADAGYDTFTDTAAVINGDTIANFAQIGNMIDATDLTFAKVTGTFAENATGTAAQLTLNDGTRALGLTLDGAFLAAGASGNLPGSGIVLASDGLNGTDIEYAGTQPVTLDGSAGHRVLIANAAGDTLTGGAGDTLDGGAGADTFAFGAGFGHETVNNFAATGSAHDVVQFATAQFADWAHLLGATTQQGSDVLITLDPDNSVTLKNVALASFTQSDARFV